MKQLVTALVVLVGVIHVLAREHSSGSHSNVIKRGAPIAAEAKGVTITQLLESPDAYGKDPVVVEGVVSKVCWIRGCWMKLFPEVGEGSIHVTFKGFTVPRDSKGWKARIAGVAKAKTGKGKSQVSFVASGVELKD
jgi:hypothetical protein